MKRALFLLALLCLLCGCSSPGVTNCAEIRLDASQVFSEAEIQAAVECVETNFRRNYHDCELNCLCYEEAAPGEKGEFPSQNDGALEGSVRNEIVLWGEYTAGADARPPFTPNNTTPCMWTLVRDDEYGEWCMDWGRCGWG